MLGEEVEFGWLGCVDPVERMCILSLRGVGGWVKEFDPCLVSVSMIVPLSSRSYCCQCLMICLVLAELAWNNESILNKGALAPLLLSVLLVVWGEGAL